jgi:hypothetical protein
MPPDYPSTFSPTGTAWDDNTNPSLNQQLEQMQRIMREYVVRYRENEWEPINRGYVAATNPPRLDPQEEMTED